jgi:hypothetical protein
MKFIKCFRLVEIKKWIVIWKCAIVVPHTTGAGGGGGGEGAILN